MQWIHTDPIRAAQHGPFGCTIAHGFLARALLTELQRDAGAWPVDVAATLNDGLEDVRFISPVRTGERIRSRTACTSVEPHNGGAWLARLASTIEIEGAPKPAMVATSLLMMFTEQGDE